MLETNVVNILAFVMGLRFVDSKTNMVLLSLKRILNMGLFLISHMRPDYNLKIGMDRLITSLGVTPF